MYQFCNATWNPIRGRCGHQCSYCFYQSNPRFKDQIKELRLDEKALKDNLGEDNFIFVGSSSDFFARDVPDEWIKKVLEKCRKYEGNTYLFQTKAPNRFWKFGGEYPRNTIFGTTLETNRDTYPDISLSPPPISRVSNMNNWFIKRKMITIEPIIQFDLEPFIEMIKKVNPEWVNIGADSKGHKLPEPSSEKINALIKELEKFTIVKIKSNLKRVSKKESK